tara:strand:+ start:556 stop:1053 length:498 start_codon:yes stop_codon:yes gene_type:complete
VNLKLFNYFLILFLLQSCSGGRIGNFLEASFKNIDPNASKIDQTNLKNNNKVLIQKKDFKNLNKKETSKISKDSSKKTVTKINTLEKQNLQTENMSNSKSKVNKNNIIQDQKKLKKIDFENQSYKVIIILKDVDPKAPSKIFSDVLKNSNINFEIEKIERFLEND